MYFKESEGNEKCTSGTWCKVFMGFALLALAVPLWSAGVTEDRKDEWVNVGGVIMAISGILIEDL